MTYFPRNHRRKRITFFVPETKWGSWFLKPDWHPQVAQASVWIRSYQLAPYLSRSGFLVECNRYDPLPDIGIFLRKYDRTSVILAEKIKSHGGKVILDVIVNYFETRPENQLGYGGAPEDMVASFSELLCLADQVWTVSPFLQNLASQHHPAVYFVSDSVDPLHFRSQHNLPPAHRPLILGWSGTAAKVHSLEEISSLLQGYSESQDVQIKIISNKKPELSFPYQFHKWHYSTFPKIISQCDLCLAPRLVNNDYDRGHSLFKIGVFMAMGVPALAGPIPSYELLLSDHLAGEICRSQEDWKYNLDQYLFNHALRQAAGDNAKEKMKPYLTPVIASQIIQLLDQS
jgi:hypothetical protein